MAMQPMRAYKPGKCAGCGGVIAMDALFVWGEHKGDRVHFPECASEQETAKVTRPKIERAWSEYQEAAFRFVEQGAGSARLLAVAGSGKTTTAEALFDRVPAHLSQLYVVFNKRNADEARDRMPEHVTVGTFHALCNQALQRHLGRANVNTNRGLGSKEGKILKAIFEEGSASEREMDDLSAPVLKLVGLAKQVGLDVLPDEPDTRETWQRLIDTYDVDISVAADENDPTYADRAEDRAVELARRVLRGSNKRLDVISFDDMLYLAVRLNVALPQFDFIAADEAQDLNKIQRAIVRMMSHANTRHVFIGDPRQAIYQFRGADARSMDAIAAEFGTIDLPLSVNYRCDRAIIRLAQTFCPEIQAHDGAGEGKVLEPERVCLHDLSPRDAIICRTTAPLVSLAFRCIREGIGCDLLGRDIGEGLEALVKTVKGKGKRAGEMSLETFLARLDDHVERQMRRFKARGDDEKAQNLEDKAECLRVAAEAVSGDDYTIEGVLNWLRGLFVDKSRGLLTLATIHKAKGGEFDRVTIVNWSKMPSKWAKTPEAKGQEANLQYVAITRAKHELILIDAECVTGEREGQEGKEGAAA